MASSNRHWPSMFRSNPACDVQQTQQPDMNNSSSSLSLFSSPGSGKPSLISSGCEESTRSPEPKPRWNPRPEQIKILEGIFNSGMVNPPRDEIHRIRLQLQEYGQVGDANVFYWFQNRKSRTKNKLRAAGQLHPAGRAALARACASPSTPTAPAPVTPPRHLLAGPVEPTSSSSSSSSRSSGSCKSVKLTALTYAPAAAQGMLPATAIDLFSPTPSPALSACQLYYHSHPMPTPMVPVCEFTSPEPLLLQWPQSQYLPATELGGVLGSHAHMPAMHPAVSTGVLLGLCNEELGQEAIGMSCSSKAIGQHLNTTCSTEPNIKTDAVSTVIREDEKARLGFLHYGFGVTTAAAAAAAVATSAPPAAPVHAAVAFADDVSTAVLPCAAPSNVATSAVLTDQLQGLLDDGLIGGTAPPTATVVALGQDAVMCASTAQYSVPAMMHLDVKLFGEAAVLLRHTGEPVLVDESGVTVEPLQQGAVYYVLATN